jgi:GDPmannose 4,6-dehydratase
VEDRASSICASENLRWRSSVAPRAVVFGASGQDGSYLCESLVNDGYEVVAAIRKDTGAPIPNLEAVRSSLLLAQVDLGDLDGVDRLLREVEPHEVYNVASVSFGPDAWSDPVRTAELGTAPVVRLLETIRSMRNPARFFQASSAWVFGRPSVAPQDEQTPYAPIEPYGAAKAFGDFLIRSYRARYDLFACSGILFNHESPRRPEQFVTRKITLAAAKASLGLQADLTLGDLEAERDWGYAGDVVRGARAMLAADAPGDYVLATGTTHSVGELAALAFERVGLDWTEHVVIDDELRRGSGAVANLVGDASLARERLGWEPSVSFEELVAMMVDADLARLANPAF